MTAAVHLSLAGRPGPSPHTHVVSGPNVKIAMARALLLRANDSLPVIWEWAKQGAALVARTPGWVGHAVLGVLSTPAGYSSAVQLVSTGVKTAWRLLDRTVCLGGRGVANVTGVSASSVRRVAPTWGEALVSAHADAVDAVNVLHDHAVHRVCSLGGRLEQLVQTSPVKTMATRAAATASGLLVVHVVTKGLLASKALSVAPALAGLIVAATSPWWLLVAVAGVTVGTITGVTYLESGKAQTPEDLVVDIAADGGITVTGIHRDMSKVEQQDLVARAAETAMININRQARQVTTRPFPRGTSRTRFRPSR